jgi:hypothetical protein
MDSRLRHLYGLWRGHVMRRRQGPRRRKDRYLAVVDWHHPQWLGVAMLIVILSVADALLTLKLLSLGATEANPFMAPLVGGSGRGFAFWKLGLTISGVVVLTALARLHLFGRLRVGAALYAVLATYIILVAYELWLLTRLGFH